MAQTNAADRRQVDWARRSDRQRLAETQVAYRETLQHPAGRRVLWDILSRAGIYRSVMDADPSRVFYNAGRQDFGHELLADLTALDESGYLLMESEARARAATEERAASAVRTTTDEESVN